MLPERIISLDIIRRIENEKVTNILLDSIEQRRLAVLSRIKAFVKWMVDSNREARSKAIGGIIDGPN